MHKIRFYPHYVFKKVPVNVLSEYEDLCWSHNTLMNCIQFLVFDSGSTSELYSNFLTDLSVHLYIVVNDKNKIHFGW